MRSQNHYGRWTKKTVYPIGGYEWTWSEAGYGILTIADVEAFYRFIIKEKQTAFHPDNDFEDYVTAIDDREGEREPAFTEEECKLYNEKNYRCFEVCKEEGADIYEIAMRITNE